MATTRRRRPRKLVRYVSPFGSPAWMTPDEAERHLRVDDARWCRLLDAEREAGPDARGLISDAQRGVGGPRIEGR